MYKIPKVKQWLKKSARRYKLIYDSKAELISDSQAMIRVTPEMKPVILEIYGHLNGGVIEHWGTGTENYSIRVPSIMTELMKPTEDSRVLIDSGLRYHNTKDKTEHRVLYFQDSGEKVVINNLFAEMFNAFSELELKSNSLSPVIVSKGNKVIGIIMPIRPNYHAYLNTFEFKVGEVN